MQTSIGGVPEWGTCFKNRNCLALSGQLLAFAWKDASSDLTIKKQRGWSNRARVSSECEVAGVAGSEESRPPLATTGQED